MTETHKTLQRKVRSWLFSEEFWLHDTPARKEGKSVEEEIISRSKSIKFIESFQDICRENRSILWVASILFHRFCCMKWISQYHPQYLCGACVSIAAKILEQPIEISVIASHIKSKWFNQSKPPPPTLDQDEISSNIFLYEKTVMTITCFDFDISWIRTKSNLMREMIANFPQEKKEEIRQFIMNTVNDSYRTELCIRFPLHHIALAIVLIACKHFELVPLTSTIFCEKSIYEALQKEFSIMGSEIELIDKNIRKICDRLIQSFSNERTSIDWSKLLPTVEIEASNASNDQSTASLLAKRKLENEKSLEIERRNRSNSFSEVFQAPVSCSPHSLPINFHSTKQVLQNRGNANFSTFFQRRNSSDGMDSSDEQNIGGYPPNTSSSDVWGGGSNCATPSELGSRNTIFPPPSDPPPSRTIVGGSIFPPPSDPPPSRTIVGGSIFPPPSDPPPSRTIVGGSMFPPPPSDPSPRTVGGSMFPPPSDPPPSVSKSAVSGSIFPPPSDPSPRTVGGSMFPPPSDPPASVSKSAVSGSMFPPPSDPSPRTVGGSIFPPPSDPPPSVSNGCALNGSVSPPSSDPPHSVINGAVGGSMFPPPSDPPPSVSHNTVDGSVFSPSSDPPHSVINGAVGGSMFPPPSDPPPSVSHNTVNGSVFPPPSDPPI